MSASREETIVDPEWENFFREKGQRQRTLRHLLGEMPVFSLLRAGSLRFSLAAIRTILLYALSTIPSAVSVGSAIASWQ